MDFEEEPGSDEPEPTILDPGQLGNDRVQMTESQIQVGNMGEKYKVKAKTFLRHNQAPHKYSQHSNQETVLFSIFPQSVS